MLFYFFLTQYGSRTHAGNKITFYNQPASLTLVQHRMLIFSLRRLAAARCADGVLLLPCHAPVFVHLCSECSRLAEGASDVVFGVIGFVVLNDPLLPEPPWHGFN